MAPLPSQCSGENRPVMVDVVAITVAMSVHSANTTLRNVMSARASPLRTSGPLVTSVKPMTWIALSDAVRPAELATVLARFVFSMRMRVPKRSGKRRNPARSLLRGAAPSSRGPARLLRSTSTVSEDERPISIVQNRRTKKQPLESLIALGIIGESVCANFSRKLSLSLTPAPR